MSLSTHPDLAPDIETASENYASRFQGEAGGYFLSVQEQSVMSLVSRISQGSLNILEVGGGHGQLTPALLKAGHTVTVHGSDESCFQRLCPLKDAYPDKLHFCVASIFELPFPNNSFDLVISVRLLAHVHHWPDLIKEMARIAIDGVVVDYAPTSGFNAFYEIFFSFKKKLEGNTRTFLRHQTSCVDQAFEQYGFKKDFQIKQFFLPMVIHRKLKHAKLSSMLEYGFNLIGLTRLLGSPVIALYSRK